jgi:uncharacterized protein YutE (UPF0331/DUF86 family)
VSDAAPPLPREIADRLRGRRLHVETLEYAKEQFGDGFPAERFVAAATSVDPSERAKVLAVERGFEILTNSVVELTVAGLEAAGLREAGEKVVAPSELTKLHEAGGIPADLCRRLIELNRVHNELQHDYPIVQAHALHVAVADLPAQLGSFLRAYSAWLRAVLESASRSAR